jgi:hypothetical protein
MAVPATANQITRLFHEREGCEAEPGSTFRGVPAAGGNGLMSEGMPNLLDYYTTMVFSTGVLRHPKVTRINHPETGPQASGETNPSMQGKGEEDDNRYAFRVLSIRSPTAFAK